MPSLEEIDYARPAFTPCKNCQELLGTCPRMADFCKQCSIEQFEQDYRELAGLCKPGEKASVFCDGCGLVWVDHNGVCQGGSECQEGHKPAAKQDEDEDN